MKNYDLYLSTKEQLDNISDYIASEVQDYSHIIFMSTGWNNDQYESLEFYSEWNEKLINLGNKKGDKIRPFIIGISWASSWPTPLMDVFNKANDADELAITHINYFLWQGLMKREESNQNLLYLLAIVLVQEC